MIQTILGVRDEAQIISLDVLLQRLKDFIGTNKSAAVIKLTPRQWTHLCGDERVLREQTKNKCVSWVAGL